MSATLADAGKYRCILASSDDKSKEQDGFVLRVYKKTSFGDTPTHVTLPVGKEGTLTCRVEFDEKVVNHEVSWLRNDRPIDMLNDSSYGVSQEDSNHVVKSELKISPVDRRHDGQYTCSASALTTDLSKIYEHTMHLETSYAPIFDSSSHIVWVEKSLGSNHAKHPVSPQVSAQGQAGSHAAGSRSNRLRHGKPFYPSSMGHGSVYGETSGDTNASLLIGANAPSSVKVELRCVCQANPPASLIWTRQSENYVLEKNSSPDIFDKVDMPADGHTTISTLVINYSFEPEYQYKNEKYICRASNAQGRADKSFKIEQGDPPPALQAVANIKHNNSAGTKLGLSSILPAASSDPSLKSVADIVPPIDKIRIRVDNEEVQTFKSRNNNHGHVDISPSSSALAVEVPIERSRAGAPSGLEFLRNLTIDISKLPSGKQRLYLDAHNPVGWSSTGTYLGEFNIVSGAFHLSHSSIITMMLLLLPLALIFMIQSEESRKLKMKI